MINRRSDDPAFVGATGDPAYKETFLSLQAMIKRGIPRPAQRLV